MSMQTTPATASRCDRIIELIDACLAEYERSTTNRPDVQEDSP